jgi:hypothetical protein
MPPAPQSLVLAHGLDFEDLYRRSGLERIDAAFGAELAAADSALHERYRAARGAPGSLDYKAEAELLIAVAPVLDRFVAGLFGIVDEWEDLVDAHHALAPLFRVEAQVRAAPRDAEDQGRRGRGLDGAALEADVAARLAAASTSSPSRARCWSGMATSGATPTTSPRPSASAPGPRTRPRAGGASAAACSSAAAARRPDEPRAGAHRPQRGYAVHTLHHIRRREGFALTDPGTGRAGALDETNYCIWCHEQGKDSCSKGLKEKTRRRTGPDASFKKSPFGVPLAGCPLEERISEFQKLKSEGWPDRARSRRSSSTTPRCARPAIASATTA